LCRSFLLPRPLGCSFSTGVMMREVLLFSVSIDTILADNKNRIKSTEQIEIP
jgi:hypothetical protein